MALSTHQRYHMKKFVKELESYRAPHTEFVTVYVPAGYDLIKIIQHLQQEQGTASNIKSAGTRNNVIDALERMIQHLRIYKQTPPNGLLAFSGNIAAAQGKSDVRVWSIEPPVPMKMRLYRCDKDFKLDVLQEMLEERETYALVTLDSRDATLGLLRGKSIIVLSKTHSHIPGKMKAGGQSAVRFQRNREIAVGEHYQKVAELMKDQFLGRQDIKGIIVGGPGPAKYEFLEGNYLTGDLQRKIIGVKDLSYTDDFGLQELLDRSQDVLAREEVADEIATVGKFLELLATKQGMVAYGKIEVQKALENGVVDTLMLSEALEEDVIDQFEATAKQFNTTVKIISTETREGAQLRDIGKVGAILRYEWHAY